MKRISSKLKQDAENGDLDAMFSLGILLHGKEDEGERSKSFEYLRKAAKKGHIESQYTLGQWTYIENPAYPDYNQESFKFMNMAAKQNHNEAQLCLAAYYMSGTGTLANKVLAQVWFYFASLNGNLYARTMNNYILSHFDTKEHLLSRELIESLSKAYNLTEDKTHE